MPELSADDASELAAEDAAEELPPPELLVLEPELLVSEDDDGDELRDSDDSELLNALEDALSEPLVDIGPLLDGVCEVPDVLLVNAPVV